MNVLNDRNLGTKPVVLILTIGLLSVAALTAYNYFNISASIYSAAGQSLPNVAQPAVNATQHEVGAILLQSLAHSLLAAGLVGLVLLGLGLWFARSLTRPLGVLARGARLLAAGDARLTGLNPADIDRMCARRDELGDLGRAFAACADYLLAKTSAAGEMARGNLAIDVPVTSDTDLLGEAMVALKTTLDNLVADADRLTQAASDGRLATRLDGGRHSGDFRKIVLGMNTVQDCAIEPINDAQHVLSQLAHGDLTVQPKGHYRGDYAPLKTSLETMVGGLRGMAERSQQVAARMTSATAEILTSSTQMAASTRQQASAVSQITSTVQQIRASAEQVAQRAQGVAATADHALSAAEKGMLSIQDTMAGMDDIRAKVEAIAENILALSEHTQQIGHIIDTVTDIAGQSNILALNAAIEAAQAGEAGRGFRVVADEVRSLAEQSRQAAAQVKAILGDVQKATNHAVMATEQGTKGVNAGGERVRSTEQAIRDIVRVVRVSDQAAQQIVAGVEQQRIGLDQIALGMNDINQAAQQLAAGAHQSQQAAGSLSQLAEQLTQAPARYTR
jgi:methyl-accepting chemotaxis protein